MLTNAEGTDKNSKDVSVSCLLDKRISTHKQSICKMRFGYDSR